MRRSVWAIAILAISAVGLVGASSASAVGAVCYAAEPSCKGINLIVSGSTIEGSSSSVLITNSTSNVTCTTSVIKWKVLASTSTGTLPGEITSLTLTNCETAGKVSCISTVKNLNYSAGLVYGGGTNGTLTLSSGGAGSPAVKLECGLSINCTFSSGLTLDAKGGMPLQIVANEESLGREGANCPKSASLDGTYNATAASPNGGNLWISE